jgi:hypothetical protein
MRAKIRLCGSCCSCSRRRQGHDRGRGPRDLLALPTFLTAPIRISQKGPYGFALGLGHGDHIPPLGGAWVFLLRHLILQRGCWITNKDRVTSLPQQGRRGAWLTAEAARLWVRLSTAGLGRPQPRAGRRFASCSPPLMPPPTVRDIRILCAA